MSSNDLIQDTGLRGIPVADTNICLINGVEGELYYRGYSIDDLAKNASFEEIIYLLLKEDLPNQEQLDEINKILRIEREVPFDVIEHLKLMPRKSDVMNVLQSTISMLSGFDDDSHIENFESNLLNAISPLRQKLSFHMQRIYFICSKEPSRELMKKRSLILVSRFMQNIALMLLLSLRG
jgi:citrate synthase